MGETVKNLPSSFTSLHPSIPWNEMARTRDKLIHGYFGIDLQLVWEITQNDLIDIKKALEDITNQSNND